MSNVTDSEERVNASFAALLDQLRSEVAPDYRKTIRANTEARERELNRVWREYGDYGLTPPSELALSITARIELGLAVVRRPQYEEAAE